MNEQKPTPAVIAFLEELAEMAEGTGRHEGHTLSQAGRCAYCSCGKRLGQADAAAMMRDRGKP